MATMNISLPQDLKDWVEAAVADGGFANSSDVVRDLIRRKKAADNLNELIDAGLRSGDSGMTLDDIWSEFEAENTADQKSLAR